MYIFAYMTTYISQNLYPHCNNTSILVVNKYINDFSILPMLGRDNAIRITSSTYARCHYDNKLSMHTYFPTVQTICRASQVLHI